MKEKDAEKRRLRVNRDLTDVTRILNEITAGTTLGLVRLLYDYELFGDIVLELKFNDELGLKITREKFTFVCDIQFKGEDFWVNKVFSVLGLEDEPNTNPDDWFEEFRRFGHILKQNWPRISEAFDKSHWHETLEKLKER